MFNRHAIHLFSTGSAVICALILFAVVVSGCPSGPEVLPSNPITMPEFGAQPREFRSPMGWENEAELEREYPSRPPLSRAEQLIQGEHFLRSQLRINSTLLRELEDVRFGLFHPEGQAAHLHVKLSAVEGKEDEYELTTEFLIPGRRVSTTIIVDSAFGMIKLTQRSYQFGESTPRFVVGKWTQRDGKQGYALSATDKPDVFLACDNRKIPEEALVVLPFAMEIGPIDAGFEVLSASYRGLFAASLITRPAHTLSKQLVKVNAFTPSGEPHWFLCDTSKNPRVQRAWTERGMHWVMGSRSEAIALANSFKIEAREQSHLLFDSTNLFSRYDLSGKDHSKSMARSWLRLSTKALDLQVAPRARLNRSSLVILADGGSISSRGNLSGSALTDNDGYRQLSLSLDYRPKAVSFDEYCKIAIHHERSQIAAKGFRRQSFKAGKCDAIRYDFKDASLASRNGNLPGFRSLVLVDAGDLVVRLSLTGGRDYEYWLDDWDQVCGTLWVAGTPHIHE